ncbi:MAG: phosphate acyltransferase PlsX [Candidatus Zixiibacteriota bacterium]
MQESRKRVILDAMGGDLGPAACVEGAVQAITEAAHPLNVTLVGDERVLHKEIHKYNFNGSHIDVVHASEVISMHDPATDGLRKKDSSIGVAMRLLREQHGDAVVSTGNTGAVMAAGLAHLGRLKGVSRPAIACLFPNQGGRTLLVDAGANPVCKPQNLMEFAVMGSVYAQRVIGVDNPRVGLLSIGEEPSKGTDLILESHRILSHSKLNFVGNVEGRDILSGRVDVVVCDGYVGNVLLKFAESLQSFLTNAVRRQISSNYFSKAGAVLMGPFLRRMKKTFDYAEYGGAPLLGLNGMCMICHGASPPKAIKNAIWAVEKGFDQDVNLRISEALEREGRARVVKE